MKSISIRIDSEMLNKLHVVADYEGRSANSQILILIRDCIEKYEDKHGKIELDKGWYFRTFIFTTFERGYFHNKTDKI